MTEKLLHFIWRMQYFNRKALCTDNNEPLQIIFPGNHNTHQGPDFLEAKIKIGSTILAGNIELHVQASDWEKHAHAGDKNYHNIILHAVWENDRQGALPRFPVLTLNRLVPKMLLKRYEELMNNSSFVPCENMAGQVSDILWASWKQRLMVERLERKSKIVGDYLTENNQHWEETFWWMLAKNFGTKVNAEVFEAVAKSISVKILAKHKSQAHQLEALLLGQCGLLEKKFDEDYSKMLQKEYHFLKGKYKLADIDMRALLLRMRPGNFPAIRLAQLAMLISRSSHLFSKLIEMKSVQEAKALLSVTASDYWSCHYVLDEAASFKKKSVGKQMAENIVINTIVPVIFAYGHFHRQNNFKEKALQWLDETASESNHIIGQWKAIGAMSSNASDSQSLIELKTQYCDKQRCLECAVGNALLKHRF
ncbi:MAG: DUF2851 family protein [Bacteroidetes bacterium]|nr:DUF2851 family protein [Bacteroidota bacterium]MBS1973810.1 DUF2851 family protein [Bacteroidota bacterium]